MGRSVCILHTGGTIGMAPGPSGLAPVAGFEDRVRALMPNGEFGWRELAPLLDSSAMMPADWQRIAAAVREAVGGYDAVVVLHGSDTLAWTGAALSFLLSDLAAPVVLTGSMVPLGGKESDAPANLALALHVARTMPGGGVRIAFGRRVMRGTRAIKVDAGRAEAFDAPSDRGFDWREVGEEPATARHDDLAPVGVVTLHPGAGRAPLDGHAGWPGLVVEAFGSGNMPGQGSDWHAGLAALRARGTEIAVVTQCLRGAVAAGTYAAGASVADLGMIPCGDMTTQAAAAKLAWLLAQGLRGTALAEAMRRPVVGEISA
ncbi:asparaginase [Roseobacter sp. HKCCA0434]|uniref:asparaginase n=1 Tax=Roseobacter sp. HKCCA0434 TaxID=3079297 RepID=UPI002905A75A|nr:asparaginase [Roseobacter sp. HKCCA0434]